jgi:hypothetical protein
LTAINNEIQESEEIVAQIINCKRKIKETKRLKQQCVNTEVEATAQTTTSDSQTEVKQEYTKIRLPKLTMPRFNGDLTKWNSFWDS